MKKEKYFDIIKRPLLTEKSSALTSGDAKEGYAFEVKFDSTKEEIMEWFQRDKQHVLQFPDFRLFRYGAVRWGIYYVLIALMAAFSGSSQEFIYFQF